jgi:predicted Zn-dependent peptidase
MREQSSAAMAVTLGQAEVMGDWKLADELVNKVKAATVEKIRDVAMKYISGVKWTYLGDVKAATAASSAFSLSVD